MIAAFFAPSAAAADGIEGRWASRVGPPDDPATVGVEIVRSPDGGSTATLTIDVVGFYAVPVGEVHPEPDGTWTAPDGGLALALAEGDLVVAGLLPDPTARSRWRPPRGCRARRATDRRRRAPPRSGPPGSAARCSLPSRSATAPATSATPTAC
jgi:hypothetical protein